MHYGLSAGKAEVGRCLGLLDLLKGSLVSERPCLQKGTGGWVWERKCPMIDTKVSVYVHQYPPAHMNIYTHEV